MPAGLISYLAYFGSSPSSRGIQSSFHRGALLLHRWITVLLAASSANTSIWPSLELHAAIGGATRRLWNSCQPDHCSGYHHLCHSTPRLSRAKTSACPDPRLAAARSTIPPGTGKSLGSVHRFAPSRRVNHA